MRKCIIATFMLLCLNAGGFHRAIADEVTKWNETATLIGTVIRTPSSNRASSR
jgi:hypothetical protein